MPISLCKQNCHTHGIRNPGGFKSSFLLFDKVGKKQHCQRNKASFGKYFLLKTYKFNWIRHISAFVVAHFAVVVRVRGTK